MVIAGWTPLNSARTVTVGQTSITYALILTKRKTVGIQIDRDGTITVRAPRRTSMKKIDRLIQKRAGWIEAKLIELEDYPPLAPARSYTDGESHLYLGKLYPLAVYQAKPESVELREGRLFITAREKNEPERIQRLLREWYRRQAREVFAQRLAANYPKIQGYGVAYPQMKIRMMKKRWGSCNSRGSVNLNLRLIQVPLEYIDYVILHELCHLVEANHSKAFYALLEKVLPDWRTLREGLNRMEVV